MSNYFKVVSKYKDAGLELPVRATAHAAGYDLAAAEDIIVPSYFALIDKIRETVPTYGVNSYSLDEMSFITKSLKAKPTLISTGMKCHLDDDKYLELAIRSSSPLKYWLICANSVGIIDADYYNNPDNEGEIFLQVINLSPLPLQIKKGEKIGQGIIKRYDTVEDDNATATRTGGFGSTTK